MLLGNIRRDMYSERRTTFNPSYLIPSFSTPMFSSSSNIRTPIATQPTVKNYTCYTTATLLSLRPPSEITNFPDHLVERRFLDEENYIDLDRMLLEKAGKFDLESFNMHDGPILPSRIHKYDFSDPIVIAKVKNRRPKDPLTPQQVAALTSVATRHQSSTLLLPNQVQSSHVWIDDYSHQQVQLNSSRYHPPPEPSMPYQRKNPNQCEIYTNQIKSRLPSYQSNDDTIPILQRLFQAQRLQQVEQGGQCDSAQTSDGDLDRQSSLHYQQGLSAFCTPATPPRSSSNKTFDWLFSTDRKDVFSQLNNQHLKYSTTMETPATPSIDISGWNKPTQNSQVDNEEQSFYSAPPSPIQQEDSSLSFLSNCKADKSCFSTAMQNQPLENWFGTSIYKNSYPRMPSDRVLSACDLEQ